MRQPLEMLEVGLLEPGLRMVLKKATALGWSGTQWRQEKEVTREKGADSLAQNSWKDSLFHTFAE